MIGFSTGSMDPASGRIFAGGYYRTWLPQQGLAANGIATRFGRVWPRDDGTLGLHDGRDDHDCDTIVLHSYLSVEYPAMVARAVAAGQNVVIDIDDDVWSIPRTNKAYVEVHPDERPEANRDHIEQMMRAATGVTVSTQALAKRVVRFSENVCIVRNAIDSGMFHVEHATLSMPGVVYGWLGDLRYRAHDLQVLRAAGIGQWLDETGSIFYHGGDASAMKDPPTPAPQVLGLSGAAFARYVSAPICDLDAYPQLWRIPDVSLVPLEDCRFNHSKSWLKGLESCAAGLPFIVSAGFREYELLADRGARCAMPRNDRPREWTDALWDLLDPDLQAEWGVVNREVAKAHDIGIRWVEWATAYREMDVLAS